MTEITKRRMWVGLIIGALLVVSAAGVWRGYFETYHFAVVQPGVLYRDGIRTPREFENMVRKIKPKTIVRLIDENEKKSEPFLSEAVFCKANGIEIVELPIRLGGWPTSDQVKRFLDLTAAPEKQPVLVHCAQGVRRTGMMVAAYQRSVLGWDEAKTKAQMLAFGHSPRTVGDVMKFIERYDPKSGATPDDLPVGKE